MKNLTHPSVVLRFDGLAVTLASVVLYRELGMSWWVFALLFLAPDVSILAYLINARVGAAAYNVLHTYVWPAGMFALGFLSARGSLMGVALIWMAHIGIDRALGLGLKYADAPFRETHLQHT
jgi:hypothetical protein